MKSNESPGHLSTLFVCPAESPDEDIELMRVVINLLLKVDKQRAHWLEIAIRANSLQNIIREGVDLDYLTAIEKLARMRVEDASDQNMYRDMALEALMQIPEGQRQTELYTWLKQNLVGVRVD